MTTNQISTQEQNSQLTTTAVISPASTPTTSDGTLLFTDTFTPTSASADIVVEVTACMDTTNANGKVLVLFEGSTCKGVRMFTAFTGYNSHLHARWVLPATDTSARTYTVRWGLSGAGTNYLNNDQTASSDYGATLKTNMTVTEVDNLIHQQTTTQTTSAASITLGSTPTSTDGLLLFTQAVTPQLASNTLVIELSVQFDTTLQNMAYTLFEDGVLVSTFTAAPFGAGYNQLQHPIWVVAAGDTDARTYTVRIGGNGSNFYINDDQTASSDFGGQFATDLVIKEYQ